MNKSDLKAKLDALNIPPANYSLEGKLITDTTVLLEKESAWFVFYIEERGEFIDKKEFNSEEEACLYLYGLFGGV